VCIAFIAHCAHSLQLQRPPRPAAKDCVHCIHRTLCTLPAPYNCRGLRAEPQMIVSVAFIALCAHSLQLQRPPRPAAKDCVHCIHRTLCTLPTTAEASKASRKRLCALHSSHIVHTPCSLQLQRPPSVAAKN